MHGSPGGKFFRVSIANYFREAGKQISYICQPDALAIGHKDFLPNETRDPEN